MYLILIRHGLAVERDEWELDDFSRPLTSKGVEKTRSAAEGIVALTSTAEIIATSPKARAIQTATVLHEAWHKTPLLEVWAELQEGDLSAWSQRIAGCNVASLCLVGHEPDLSRFASWLLCGDEDRVQIEWKKAGALALELDKSKTRGELLWMLPPRVLRRLGE